MATYFFDTSALVKYYIQEQGRSWVRSIIDAPRPSNTIIVANITYAELMATFARLTREARMEVAQMHTLAATVGRQFARRKYQRRAITWDVIQEAGRLATTYAQAGQGLRGYDAVQLACAVRENQSLIVQQQAPLIFVTADLRLAHIATQTGLISLDPTAQ